AAAAPSAHPRRFASVVLRNATSPAVPAPDPARTSPRIPASARASTSTATLHSPAPAAPPLRLVPSHRSAPHFPVPSPGSTVGSFGLAPLGPPALLLLGLAGWLLGPEPPRRLSRLRHPENAPRSSPAPLALERPG